MVEIGNYVFGADKCRWLPVTADRRRFWKTVAAAIGTTPFLTLWHSKCRPLNRKKALPAHPAQAFNIQQPPTPPVQEFFTLYRLELFVKVIPQGYSLS